jgi:hypothetical protein
LKILVLHSWNAASASVFPQAVESARLTPCDLPRLLDMLRTGWINVAHFLLRNSGRC